MGTATPDPGDPSNSTASSPRLGRGLKIRLNYSATKEEYSAATNLVTSRLRDTVGLTLVLGNVVVHQRDNVRPANIQNDTKFATRSPPDRSSEDSWETDGGASGSILVAVNADQRPRRCQRHLGF